MFYETSTLKDRLNKAVEAERQRWIQRLREQRWLSSTVCRAITETLMAPEPEPPSPAEPITVEKLLEALRHFAIVTTDTTWELIETDLQALVEASKQGQARRDAKVCSELSEGVTRKTESLGEHECRLKGYAEAHNAILKEAGLE